MSDQEEIGYRKKFLFNIEFKFHQATKDMKHDLMQDYLFRFEYLSNKFDMLFLIVERILNVDYTKAKNMKTKTYFNFLIDLEAYFYLIVSTLDILAKITPYFYSEWIGKKETKRYFSHQIKFLKENPNIDDEYAKYLNNNMEWFCKVRKHRNELTHRGALIIFPTSKNDFFFGTKREKKEFVPNGEELEVTQTYILNFEVKSFINETFQEFLNFLKYYNSYFANKSLNL